MVLDIRKKLTIALASAVFLVVADQIIKYLVRVYIGQGPAVEVASWFKLCFVENPGMAFGMQLCPKIFLTVFRIVAVGLLGYCSYTVIKRGFTFGFAIALTMVTAGALGNIIDCVFYARIFDGGDFFVGKVVDMFYFPIIRTTWPDWSPWAGQSFIFFRPVFNLADSAITCSVFFMVFFRSKELGKLLELFTSDKEEKKEDDGKQESTDNLNSADNETTK